MQKERLMQDIKPFEIAKEFGISEEFVSSIFSKKKTSINDVLFVCNFFQIDIDDYFNNQKDKYIKGMYGTANRIPSKFDLDIFANNFKTLRIAKGYTVKELGELLYCEVRTIQYWEAAEKTPPIDRILEIANFFKVPVSYLLYK